MRLPTWRDRQRLRCAHRPQPLLHLLLLALALAAAAPRAARAQGLVSDPQAALGSSGAYQAAQLIYKSSTAFRAQYKVGAPLRAADERWRARAPLHSLLPARCAAWRRHHNPFLTTTTPPTAPAYHNHPCTHRAVQHARRVQRQLWLALLHGRRHGHHGGNHHGGQPAAL